MTTNATADLVLTVHGPVGVLDLVVPAGAAAADVAEEYALQAGLSAIPVLCTRVGAVLPADQPLARVGVRAGDVLVATTSVVPVAGRGSATAAEAASAGGPTRAGATAATWAAAVAAACAAGAGWCAATAGDDRLRLVTVLVLVAAAVLGAVPMGRYAAQRAVVAPAFAASAALAVAWDPHPVRLPVVAGVCGLVAALAAAATRAVGRSADEALQVWVIAGSALFVTTWMCTLAGAPPRLTWALLLLVAALAARIVPGIVVDVPDQYLIDLERLAVTAWSARDRPSSRRGRSVVPHDAVSAVAARGAGLLTAATAAIAAVALVAAPLLLDVAVLRIDRIGAWVLVGTAGAALLLAARSYRHRAARALLRTAGLGCWVALLVAVVPLLGDRGVWTLAITAFGLGAVVVVVAVATGRGWRSAWWSRRAEVAEGLCGAFAIGAFVVAAGWFRAVWEWTSLWQLGQ